MNSFRTIDGRSLERDCRRSEADKAIAVSTKPMSSPLRIVTTSWDDGDRADINIAAMLRARSLRGTFYVPVRSEVTTSSLTPSELVTLVDEGFEIGAHTVSHLRLPGLTEEQIRYEVASCKDTIEQTIAKPVSMFCYPGGRLNRNVTREVQLSGYEGARTTRMLSTNLDFLPFEMPTTLQAYPHREGAYLRNSLRPPNMRRLLSYLTLLDRCGDWVELGHKLFDLVLENGGMWHLYGHSWEIESLGLWNQLGRMLDYVKDRDGVLYLTNGELTQLLRNQPGWAAAGTSSTILTQQQ